MHIMKNLLQYITEAGMRSDDVILTKLDINLKDDLRKIEKQIRDIIDEALVKYETLRVKTVEIANAEATERNDKFVAKHMEYAYKQVIKLLQTKPGILKRSTEKQQQWINDKLAKEEEKYRRVYHPYLNDPKTNYENLKMTWRSDIYSQMSGSQITGMNKVDNLVEYIMDDIKRAKDDLMHPEKNKSGMKLAWPNLQSIVFTSTKSGLTSTSGYIDIYPMFDEETEKDLDKSVQRTCDAISRMYASGRYMGD